MHATRIGSSEVSELSKPGYRPAHRFPVKPSAERGNLVARLFTQPFQNHALTLFNACDTGTHSRQSADHSETLRVRRPATLDPTGVLSRGSPGHHV